MKQITGNTLVKFIAALLCVAMLTGCVWFGFFGILFTAADRDDAINGIMELSMEEATRFAYYHMDELQYMQENPDEEWSSEYIQKMFDPELTNFRYQIITNGEEGIVLSNFDPETEPYLAKYTNWEESFDATEVQRQRLQAFETGAPYNYATDEYLPDRGYERYEVTKDLKLPKEYVSYDEEGYLYDEDGNAVAIISNFHELSWVVEAEVEDTVLVVDGVNYYPIDPDAGYPGYFAYMDESGMIFDRDLYYITTEEIYNSRFDNTSITVSPTPKPVVSNSASNAQVKPEIVELGVFTHEDYKKLYEECHTQYWIVGYLALTEVPVTGVDIGITDDGEPVAELGLAVNDKYSELYHYLQSLSITPAKEQLQNAMLLGGGALLLLIFLMMAAGRRADSDEVVLRVVDRMPLDLWLVFVCCGGGLAVMGVWFCVEFGAYSVMAGAEMFELFLMSCFAVAVLTFAFCVWMLMSFAARVKVKGWWRNCLCARILVICWQLLVKFIKWCWKLFVKCLKWCQRLCKNLAGAMGGGIRKIPLVWHVAIVMGIISVLEIIFCAYIPDDIAAVGMLWVCVKYVLCIGICLALKRLQAGARIIADGDLNHRVSTKYLYGDFKEHAENLNRIGDGLSRSVDSQLRSERMKTELITNVSHDLKTPLTSIVNYVDLLKKEHLEGTAAEYVEVLDRQSARLKKLTEDLVEASKASTGSLNVAVERVKLGELIEQAQAEYAERLATSGLKTMTRIPEEPVEVWADGKYVWRILDNLLSNVCKYAMPDTRVYLDVRKEGERAVLSVKNISRECLNISADELMERFVRGDSSRATEGSGLGLSIAQSLAKLMGGDVNIVVDGDLFKAEVSLPLVK